MWITPEFSLDPSCVNCTRPQAPSLATPSSEYPNRDHANAQSHNPRRGYGLESRMQGMNLRAKKAPFFFASTLRHLAVAIRRISLSCATETDRTVSGHKHRGTLDGKRQRIAALDAECREQTESCPSLRNMEDRLSIRGFRPSDCSTHFLLSRIHHSNPVDRRYRRLRLWHDPHSVIPFRNSEPEFRMRTDERLFQTLPSGHSPRKSRNLNTLAAIREECSIFGTGAAMQPKK